MTDMKTTKMTTEREIAGQKIQCWD